MASEQDILKIGFDYKQTQSDADKVVASLKSVLDYADKFSSLKDILAGGTAGFAESKKSADALTATLKNQAKVVDDYSKSVIASAKAQAAEAKASQESQKAKQQGLKTDQEVVKLIKEEEKATQENLKTQKQSLQYKIALEKEKLRGAKASEAEGRLISRAADEYYQLGQALKDAELKYKNLALTQGLGHEQTQVALKDALAIRGVLDKVDQSLGNYQRNVGNYGSAFNGLGNSIQQILREAPSAAVSLNTFFLAISNNLPMFFDEITKIKEEQKQANIVTKEAAILAKEQAIATAINAGATKEAALAEGLLAEKTIIANAAATAAPSIFKRITASLFSLQSMLTIGVLLLTVFGSQVIASVGSLFKGSKALDDNAKAMDRNKQALNDLTLSTGELKVSQENLNKAMQEGSYTDAISLVSELTENIRLAKEGFLDKKEVLHQYNETIGKTTGEVQTLDAAEQAMVKNGDAYVRMILYKAAAEITRSEAAKKLVEAQIEYQRKLDIAKDVSRKGEAAKDKATGADGLSEFFERGLKNETEKAKRDADSEVNSLEKIALDFQKKAAEIAKKFGFDFFEGEEDEKGKKEKDIKTVADALAELRKELELISKKQVTGLLGDTDADLERVKAYQKAFEEMFERGANESTPIVKQLLFELNPISVRILEDHVKEFLDKTSEGISKLSPANAFKELMKGAPDALKKFKDEQTKAYEETLSFRQQIAAKDLALQQQSLNVQYNTGKISEREYQEALLDVQEEYAQKALKIQISEYYNALQYAFIGVENTKENADKRLEIEKKLAEAQAELGKSIIKNDKRNLEERRANLIKFLVDAQAVMSEVAGLIGDIVNIGVTKDKNALRANEDEREKNYQNELTRITASTLSEEDKVNRVKLLEAQRQAQKEEFDRKNREADIKRARFEKAAAISQIILQGVLATVKAAGRSLFEAFAVGALYAAKLAIAIATPIPTFAKGVKNKKDDGFGVFGEAGAEKVEIPGQKPFIATEATFGYLPKGTSITPLSKDDINSVMYRGMAQQMSHAIGGTKPDKSELLLMQLINETKKANSKKSSFQFNFHHDPAWIERKTRYYS